MNNRVKIAVTIEYDSDEMTRQNVLDILTENFQVDREADGLRLGIISSEFVSDEVPARCDGLNFEWESSPLTNVESQMTREIFE